MRALIVTGLLLASTAAAAQEVSVGTGDWSAYPAVQERGELRMSDQLMDRIEQIAAERVCSNVEGLGPTAVDISVPFMIRYKQDGTVEHIVLKHLGCPALETTLGATVLQMARAGQYRPAELGRDGWYRGEISFANR